MTDSDFQFSDSFYKALDSVSNMCLEEVTIDFLTNDEGEILAYFED